LARSRDGGPGIRRARVVASQARAAFSGSRRGDGNTGVSGVSLTGRSFFLARSLPTVPQPCRSAAERATDVGHEDLPFLVYASLTLELQSRYGAGLATSSPLLGTAARPLSCSAGICNKRYFIWPFGRCGLVPLCRRVSPGNGRCPPPRAPLVSCLPLRKKERFGSMEAVEGPRALRARHFSRGGDARRCR
jgi:hypothetical protein